MTFLLNRIFNDYNVNYSYKHNNRNCNSNKISSLCEVGSTEKGGFIMKRSIKYPSGYPFKLNNYYLIKKSNFSRNYSTTAHNAAKSITRCNNNSTSPVVPLLVVRNLSNLDNSLLSRLLKLVIAIISLAIAISVFYLFTIKLLPVLSESRPVIEPYARYIRYFLMITISISIYRLIINWKTTKAVNPYAPKPVKSNDHMSVNEFGVIELDIYRWWVNPLRIIVGLSLLSFFVFKYSTALSLFKAHPIIFSIFVLLIIGWIIIFSNEYLNLEMPTRLNPPQIIIPKSHYSNTIGRFLDWYASTHFPRLIYLLAQLNYFAYLILMDAFSNPDGISAGMFMIKMFILLGIQLSVLYYMILITLNIYIWILSIFIPAPDAELKPTFKYKNNTTKLNNRRSFSTSATSLSKVAKTALEKTIASTAKGVESTASSSNIQSLTPAKPNYITPKYQRADSNTSLAQISQSPYEEISRLNQENMGLRLKISEQNLDFKRMLKNKEFDSLYKKTSFKQKMDYILHNPEKLRTVRNLVFQYVSKNKIKVSLFAAELMHLIVICLLFTFALFTEKMELREMISIDFMKAIRDNITDLLEFAYSGLFESESDFDFRLLNSKLEVIRELITKVYLKRVNASAPLTPISENFYLKSWEMIGSLEIKIRDFKSAGDTLSTDGYTKAKSAYQTALRIVQAKSSTNEEALERLYTETLQELASDLNVKLDDVLAEEAPVSQTESDQLGKKSRPGWLKGWFNPASLADFTPNAEPTFDRSTTNTVEPSSALPSNTETSQAQAQAETQSQTQGQAEIQSQAQTQSQAQAQAQAQGQAETQSQTQSQAQSTGQTNLPQVPQTDPRIVDIQNRTNNL